jgi:hypothetical protein
MEEIKKARGKEGKRKQWKKKRDGILSYFVEWGLKGMNGYLD